MHPSLVWNTRQLNPGYFCCSLLYLPISRFISLFYFQIEPATGDKPGGVSTTSTGLQRHKWELALGLSPFSIGGYPKKDSCRFYRIQLRDFSCFSFLFRLDKDANHLLPADLPGHRLPAHGTAANKPPYPTPTQDIHQDTQHSRWQGMWNGTGYPVGGTRRIGYHVTDVENSDEEVLQ